MINESPKWKNARSITLVALHPLNLSKILSPAGEHNEVIPGPNFSLNRQAKTRRHKKSEKLFGYPTRYPICDIRNIDLRNPKYFAYLTYKHST